MTCVASTTQFLSSWLLVHKQPLPHLLSTRRSPLVLIQQFLSKLLSQGEWPVLPDADTSYFAVQQALTTYAGLFMRWQLRLSGWDYSLLSLPFLPKKQAESIARNFFACNACCLPGAFSARIQRIIKRAVFAQCSESSDAEIERCRVAVLLGPQWAQVLSIVAHRVSLSTLEVEAAHSRHRHLCRCANSKSIEGLAAEACLQEAKLLADVPKGKQDSWHQPSQPEHAKQRMSAKQLLHYMRLGSGPNKGKWFTKDQWAKTAGLWSSLTTASRAALESFSLVPQNIAQRAIRNATKMLGESARSKAEGGNASSNGVIVWDVQEQTKPLLPSSVKSVYPVDADAWQEAISNLDAKPRAKVWDGAFQQPAGHASMSSPPGVPHCHQHLCRKQCDARVASLKRVLNLIAKTADGRDFTTQFPLFIVHSDSGATNLAGQFFLMAHIAPCACS